MKSMKKGYFDIPARHEAAALSHYRGALKRWAGFKRFVFLEKTTIETDLGTIFRVIWFDPTDLDDDLPPTSLEEAREIREALLEDGEVIHATDRAMMAAA